MTGQGIGASPARVGGRDRVTGRQAYVADIRLEDALHVKLVTVDCARARIGAIDTSAALAVPGVRLVVDRRGPAPADAAVRPAVPGPAGARGRRDALPRRAGRRGRRRDPRRRRGGGPRSSGSSTRRCRRSSRSPPRWIPQRRSSRTRRSARATRSRPRTSSASTTTAGATSTAAARADVVVEGTYVFPMVTQFAIEPHALHRRAGRRRDRGLELDPAPELAPAGRRRACSGCRWRRSACSRPTRAAAFGGKQHAKYEPLVAFMALAAGRPVRLVLTLEETFQAVRRGASEIRRPDRASGATARWCSATSRRTT